MNRLQINDLTKTYYTGVKALKGIKLEFMNGMFGLIGSIGAGKSSLIRIITSFLEPSSRSISFNNIDVVKQSNERRMQLSYLPLNIYQM